MSRNSTYSVIRFYDVLFTVGEHNFGVSDEHGILGYKGPLGFFVVEHPNGEHVTKTIKIPTGDLNSKGKLIYTTKTEKVPCKWKERDVFTHWGRYHPNRWTPGPKPIMVPTDVFTKILNKAIGDAGVDMVRKKLHI